MSTTTVRKQEKALHIIGRAQFKANGLVLYRIASGENHYDVTVAGGKVTCCVDQDGNSCKGWMYQHTCKHTDLVAAKEAERVALEHKIDQDMEAHVEDDLRSPVPPRRQIEAWTEEEELRYNAPLNGNRGFSLLK